MNPRIGKDDIIQLALDCLKARLGNDAFQIVDHWGADNSAVGVASPSDVHRLVYLSHVGGSIKPYRGFLETAPMADSELPFENCGEFDDVDLNELVDIVSKNLRIRPIL